MNWNDIVEFFRMGGHGYYIWMAYGFVLIGIVFEIFSLRQRRRAICQRLMREARVEQSMMERQ